MWRLCVLCCCLGLASCSKKYGDHPPHPVSGRVLVNGEPAKGAQVVFHHLGDWGEKSIVPQAYTADDGKFALSTYGVGDGAPAGDYQVVVRWPAYRRGRNVGPDRLDGKFSKPDTSGLTAHVDAGNNDLPPFDLKATLLEIGPDDADNTGGAKGGRK